MRIRHTLSVFFLFAAASVFFGPVLRAAEGDTIRVTTWVDDEYTWPVTHVQTFGGFPDTSKTFRKIIMRYTLGCASGGCDPWDVGAPIHVRHPLNGGGTEDIEIGRFITPYAKTGVWDFDVTDYHMLLRDSVTLTHRNASYTSGPQGFRVTIVFLFIEGTPPREAFDYKRLWQGGYRYGNNTTTTNMLLEVDTTATGDSAYDYTFDKFLVIDSVISFDSAIVGSGSTPGSEVLGASRPDAKSQILLRAGELSSAGLTAGDITGLRVQVTGVGSRLDQLTLKMKHTTQTALSTTNFESTGFTTVYQAHSQIPFTGWIQINFTNPFTWNGSDNILLDVNYDNKAIGTDNALAGDYLGYNAMIYNRSLDYYMEFNDTSSVIVPAAPFANLDSFITVAFWQNGDMDYQPQNDYLFEALDGNGDRVLNCHMPWGNSQVYWDAGNNGGSYDRINKAAAPDEYQAFWTHWAFTKNVATGEMKIYRNGSLWHSGTGFTNLMANISTFRIGSNGPGSNFYDGKVDEFQVWDVELDSTTIQNWMYRRPTTSHPNWSNLLVYYPFNDGTGSTVTDWSAGGNNATVSGTPVWEGHNREGAAMKAPDQNVSTWRPNLVLEQGVYQSHLDSVLADSTLRLVVNSYLIYNHFDSITPPMTVTIPSNAHTVGLKFRTTGHGFGGNLNCAEFCRRDHYIKVNGSTYWTHEVWNDDCGMNPCYPQGGTWIYDRAGWCPGEDVETFDVDMTPVCTPGSTVTLDYSAMDYSWNGSGSAPNWSLANHLIYYHPPAHALDAAVDDIISPNDKFTHGRFNPICRHPEIMIQNTGTTTLTSLDIHFMVEGGADSVFSWTGSLDFLEKERVELGEVDWSPANGRFKVWVTNPNGGTDEYATNDTMYSVFSRPPSYPNDIYLFWRTNNAGSETKYQVLDMDGNLIYQNSPFIGPNTTFRDTFRLQQGCYTFRLYDTGKDGLSFFANNDGSGYARIFPVGGGSALKTFNPDFGTQILWDFTVDTPLSNEEPEGNSQFEVFPNPTNGSLSIMAGFTRTRSGRIEVLDIVGKPVRTLEFSGLRNFEQEMDLSAEADGIYFVRLVTGNEVITRKIVLSKTH